MIRLGWSDSFIITIIINPYLIYFVLGAWSGGPLVLGDCDAGLFSVY